MDPTCGHHKPLPRYKSHKIVEALKIKELRPPEQPLYKAPVCRAMDYGSGCRACERCAWLRDVFPTAPWWMVPAEEGFDRYQLSAAFIAKHKPQVGGYLVFYEDRYESYSPARAFEEGYTRIPEQFAPAAQSAGQVDCGGRTGNAGDA